ncbi:polyamine aminopropyltransferase [Streptomyces iconiensis]|uniref:Polyamine aminopropyltransferase n=1 Tax=Streptomyces iconiensis TaxID=1384038 RepID=A0ABT7AAE5_9ACTN|nr:polyamine aminopropyltransferase [Streptomyces iconiensis]MDJ1138316.1 polyamine aminopropyltransferase [Streptomyces iconiensis]
MIHRSPAVERGARLPVPAALGRGFVLASVFLCAACGLVYELELVALASYLAGDSVTQASVVLSVMVFAMGVGSLLAKRLCGCAAAGFGYIEALLALIGGGSAMALYASFAWFGEARIALVVISFTIGVLIGAEMPLLMTLIQRIRAQDPGGALADLFAADYVGALVGGLAFPFLLLPLYGQLTGTLLTGVVNAFAGGMVVLWLFRHDLSTSGRLRLLAANAAVLALLVAGAAFVDDFERAARHAVYGGDIRVAVRTGMQELVLTGGAERREWPRAGELRLFLDGRLSVRGSDERKYHEALVRPAMAEGPRSRVLVLGGGDGLAVREVLRYSDVRSVTVVERDPGVTRLARSDPGLRALNGGSLDDPRVRTVAGDAFGWLRARSHAGSGPFDVILSGLPDPGISSSTKLYSQEFYGLAARSLAREGRLAVHASSPGSRRRDFWTVESTVRSVGLRTWPYQVKGAGVAFTSGPDRSLRRSPGGGEGSWGFVLAQRGGRCCPLATEGYREAERRAARGRLKGLPPSTLVHPRYLE